MEGEASSAKQCIPVYLEPEQIAALERLSKEHDRKKGFFVRKAVDAYLLHLEGLCEGAEAAR